MDVLQFLADLKQIEKILLTCHGKRGKSALIQSQLKQNPESEATVSFVLTNDAITILNSMTFYDNQILLLLVNTVRKHSKSVGDNCKTLFVYVLSMLSSLYESNNRQDEAEKVVSFFRRANLVEIYEEFLGEWNIVEPDLAIKLTKIDHFVDILPKLTVLSDLHSLNKTLSKISSQLVLDLVKNYIAAKSTEHELELEHVPSILNEILDDLEYTLVYSDRYTLDRSRLFANGFLLDYKVLLNHFDKHQTEDKINAMFLLVSNQADSSEKSNIHIEISSKYHETILNSFYAQKTNFFSAEFMSYLRINSIRVIFTSGCLSELQKSQLNSVQVSLISYISVDLIRFICRKLGVEPIEIEAISTDDFSQILTRSNLIALESVECIENEKLTFFKVLGQELNLNFIYFSSPIKLQFSQFRSHVLKVLKTLLSNFDEINLVDKSGNENIRNLFVKTSFFEAYSLRVVEHLKNVHCKNAEKLLFYSFLGKTFASINCKLSGGKVLTRSLDEITTVKSENFFQVEPLSLKLTCFLKSLHFVQSVLKIDKVFLVKNKRLAAS